MMDGVSGTVGRDIARLQAMFDSGQLKKLTENQVAILIRLMASQGGMSATDIAAAMQKQTSSVKRTLSSLIDKGMVVLDDMENVYRLLVRKNVQEDAENEELEEVAEAEPEIEEEPSRPIRWYRQVFPLFGKNRKQRRREMAMSKQNNDGAPKFVTSQHKLTKNRRLRKIEKARRIASQGGR